MGWPNRIKSGIDIINLTKQEPLTFFEISKEKFPCFFLAKEVAKEAGSYPTAMNAANEVAVKYFLDKIIKFNDIYKIISDVMDIHKKTTLISIDDVFEVDKESRNLAETIVKKYK